MTTGIAALVLAALGVVAADRTSPAVDAPAVDLQGCLDVEWDSGDRVVRYVGDAFDFSIDRQERALDPDVQSARATCAAEGKRMCASSEVYMACLCGYASDQDPEALARPWENAPILDRWRRDCVTRDDPDPAVCQSDHGVELLLGGLSEVTADTMAGAHLVAGPNQAMEESWMAGCTYRGVMSSSAIREHGFSFLGYRCCSGTPPGSGGEAGLEPGEGASP